MLSKFEVDSARGRKNAIRQIIQEAALAGLSRTDFFNKAAFYGGTSLRIFHNLGRYSEDLDFCLVNPDSSFNFENYFSSIEKELMSIGYKVTVKMKVKSIDKNVKTAFIVGDAKELLKLTFGDIARSDASRDELIRVKMDVNTTPKLGVNYELKEGALPSYYTATVYDLSSLFAGKICACLTRGWRHRTKGRDFYDYIFFIDNKIKFNLFALKSMLVKAEVIKEYYDLTLEEVKEMLKNRFEIANYELAKTDVYNFTSTTESKVIKSWNKDYFINATERLECE